MSFLFFKNKNREFFQKGMTYVELIVVMAIFSVLYGVVIFNYRSFQDKVAIKNLSVDIASTVTKAQQNAVGGVLPVFYPQNWKPSYGVYFSSEAEDNNNKNFYYFVDTAPIGFSDGLFEQITKDICPRTAIDHECLEKISITGGNYVSKIEIMDISSGLVSVVEEVNISFVRPNTIARIKSPGFFGTVYYVDITISSASSVESVIRVYSAGRVDII